MQHRKKLLVYSPQHHEVSGDGCITNLAAINVSISVINVVDFLSVSLLRYRRLLNRNKKAEETKSSVQNTKSRKGFFGRKKKESNNKKIEEKKPADKEKEFKPTEEKAVAPEPSASTAVVENKAGEATSNVESPKKDEIIPETVHSSDEDSVSAAKQQQPPPTPAKDAPKGEIPTTPRDPDGERCSVPASTQKTTGVEGEVKEKKATGESPVEPEGRNEEAEGETPEKNSAKQSSSREGTEPEGASKMSVEDPPEENPGLLCGCI